MPPRPWAVAIATMVSDGENMLVEGEVTKCERRRTKDTCSGRHPRVSRSCLRWSERFADAAIFSFRWLRSFVLNSAPPSPPLPPHRDNHRLQKRIADAL